MKGKRIKIGIAVLVVAVLAVGAFAGTKVAGMVRKAMMDPAEYYQYVETKNRDDGETFMFGYYDAIRKSYSGDTYARNVNMKMELSDTAKALLSLVGVDFSGVNNLELDTVIGREKQQFSNQVKVKGNDNDLLTVNTYMDFDGEKAYYQIPELSASYLDISSAFDGTRDEENAAGVGFEEMMPLYNMDQILIETNDLKSIYERYTDILIKNAKNVKKAEGSTEGITAEGVTQKADRYTVTMEGKEVSNLLKELLQALKNDKTLQGMIDNIDKEAYQECQDSLDAELEKLDKETDGQCTLSMDVYIGSGDKIIGRRVKFNDGTKEELTVNISCPMDGDKFGYSISAAAGDVEYFNLHGNGTFKMGVMNGKFTLGIDSSPGERTKSLTSTDKLLIMELQDYDISKMEKGEVSGTITYSTEAIAELANYSFKVESKGNLNETTGKISILSGSEVFATIDVTMKSSDKPEMFKPSDSDTVYDVNKNGDMLKYQAEMDIMQLLEDIQDKLGIDLSGLIGGLLEAM